MGYLVWRNHWKKPSIRLPFSILCIATSWKLQCQCDCLDNIYFVTHTTVSYSSAKMNGVELLQSAPFLCLDQFVFTVEQYPSQYTCLPEILTFRLDDFLMQLEAGLESWQMWPFIGRVVMSEIEITIDWLENYLLSNLVLIAFHATAGGFLILSFLWIISVKCSLCCCLIRFVYN